MRWTFLLFVWPQAPAGTSVPLGFSPQGRRWRSRAVRLDVAALLKGYDEPQYRDPDRSTGFTPWLLEPYNTDRASIRKIVEKLSISQPNKDNDHPNGATAPAGRMARKPKGADATAGA